MIDILLIIFYGILCVIAHRYILCPVIYWIAAVLDEFKTSFSYTGKYWFQPCNHTINDFVERQKNICAYNFYIFYRWVPPVGIICMLLYLMYIIVITNILYFIAYIIVNIFTLLWDYILFPICKYIIKILKFLNIITIIKEIIKQKNKLTNKILNIKLHKN